MSTPAQMWIWAVVLPLITFLSRSMCVWPLPRFLGFVSMILLWASDWTMLFFLAAVPASVFYGITSLIHRQDASEFSRRLSMALSCLCFSGLWILAVVSTSSLRHGAFVHASRIGDRVVHALAKYRHDEGEYPDDLDRLTPGYLDEIPFTGMIAYPEFSYHKNHNDAQSAPGSYELRINCTSGAINFDRFIYWPSETYPDRIQGNFVERIGKWVYVHE